MLAGASSANTHTLTRRVFLAPFVPLMMMVSGPPMEQMFFSRAPPHTGTLETVKSCTGEGGWNETVVKETSSWAWIPFSFVTPKNDTPSWRPTPLHRVKVSVATENTHTRRSGCVHCKKALNIELNHWKAFWNQIQRKWVNTASFIQHVDQSPLIQARRAHTYTHTHNPELNVCEFKQQKVAESILMSVSRLGLHSSSCCCCSPTAELDSDRLRPTGSWVGRRASVHLCGISPWKCRPARRLLCGWCERRCRRRTPSPWRGRRCPPTWPRGSRPPGRPSPPPSASNQTSPFSPPPPAEMRREPSCSLCLIFFKSGFKSLKLYKCIDLIFESDKDAEVPSNSHH